MATELTTPLNERERAALAKVGYADEAGRAGTCVITDHAVRHISVNDDRVEILPIADALARYDWVQDLFFGQIREDENDEVRAIALSPEPPVGHFIRVRADAKLDTPIQVFCLLETPQARQVLHNLTIVEEGAEASIISGSAVAENVHTGQHICLCETYLREGAVCHSLSIEQWAESVDVTCYDRSDIAKDAHVEAKAVKITPVRNHRSLTHISVGENGTANDQTVVFAPEGATRVMDSEYRLEGKGARSENLTRMVAGGGKIDNRAMIVGEGDDCYGFLGCDGLKLSRAGEIQSVPALKAISEKAQLSHEASIGMISEEKLAYLESSGMDEEQASQLIVQGFLELKEQEMPEQVRETMIDMIAAARSGSM